MVGLYECVKAQWEIYENLFELTDQVSLQENDKHYKNKSYILLYMFYLYTYILERPWREYFSPKLYLLTFNWRQI